MLNVGEVNLIGEFAEQALKAGLVRDLRAAATVSLIFEVLRREAAEAQQRQAIEQKAVREKEIREAAEKLNAVASPKATAQASVDATPPASIEDSIKAALTRKALRGDRE